jgi:hypothetical protein
VVVAGARLEACGGAGGFDPSYQALLGEHPKCVVHTLRARLAESFAYGGGDVVGVRMWLGDNGVVRREPGRGDAQAGGAEVGRGVDVPTLVPLSGTMQDKIS